MANRTKYSYSKLDTYEKCPFKFWLQYIEGHFVNTDNLAVSFGSLVHQTEETIANTLAAGKEVDYKTLITDFVERVNKLRTKFPNDANTADKSGRILIDKANYYLNDTIYNLEAYMKEHPTYTIYGTEKKFLCNYLETVLLNGSIDRIFYDKATDTYILQDIKTYAVPIKDDELTTPLQFVTYMLALNIMDNIPFEKMRCEYYLPLCTGTDGKPGLTQPAGTKGFLGRGIKKLAKILGNIDAKVFNPKPTTLCNYCQFCQTNPDAPKEAKYLCPYFSYWNRITRDRADIKICENEFNGLDEYPSLLEAYKKKFGVTNNL